MVAATRGSALLAEQPGQRRGFAAFSVADWFASSFMCEMPTVYQCDRPTARKEHKCYECRGAIRPGEKYRKHHGIWDGQPGDYKVCDQCEDLRTLVDAGVAHSEDKTAFGQLYETVFESRDLHWIRAYLSNARARGGQVLEWMTKREAELLANGCDALRPERSEGR